MIQNGRNRSRCVASFNYSFVDSLLYNLHQSPPSSAMASSTQCVPSADAADEVFQKIIAHQENAARLPSIEEVRTILHHSIRGMLSTFSQKHEGYPSGSMVDFACDAYGSPILAVSNLAVHTKDLLANPKCSLLVAKDPEDRTDLVITLHGDAISVPETDRDAVRTSYLARHPDAFWSSPTRSSKKQRRIKSQFSKPISSHMNKDHSHDTKLIVQHSTSVLVEFAYMVDVDSLGFNVKAGYEGRKFKLRIPFPRAAEERKDVKRLIIEMLEAAKSQH